MSGLPTVAVKNKKHINVNNTIIYIHIVPKHTSTHVIIYLFIPSMNILIVIGTKDEEYLTCSVLWYSQPVTTYNKPTGELRSGWVRIVQ